MSAHRPPTDVTARGRRRLAEPRLTRRHRRTVSVLGCRPDGGAGATVVMAPRASGSHSSTRRGRAARRAAAGFDHQPPGLQVPMAVAQPLPPGLDPGQAQVGLDGAAPTNPASPTGSGWCPARGPGPPVAGRHPCAPGASDPSPPRRPRPRRRPPPRPTGRGSARSPGPAAPAPPRPRPRPPGPDRDTPPPRPMNRRSRDRPPGPAPSRRRPPLRSAPRCPGPDPRRRADPTPAGRGRAGPAPPVRGPGPPAGWPGSPRPGQEQAGGQEQAARTEQTAWTQYRTVVRGWQVGRVR